jgi:hypothetical protein
MVILDLVDQAVNAKWTNGYVTLPWATDVDGVLVQHAENVAVEDGRVAPRVIEVCPRRPQGAVVGRFADVTIPPEGAQVRTGLSFRQGGGGGGAYFSVIAEFAGEATSLRREYYKAEGTHVIEDLHYDLARFAGMTGTIGLMVEGVSPGANPVWMNTQLVSLVGEYPFAEYVGAAVGSGIEGGTLVNPWGGKSGVLFGEVFVLLEFRNIDIPYSLYLSSAYEGQDRGMVDLGTLTPGQTTVTTSLTRTERGRWTERVIFNSSYYADIRYTVNDDGE